MSYRALALLVSVATLPLAAGCGGEDWQAETYPATGRITINGQAPAGALVQLSPIGQKVDERDSRPWGKVQPDGTYTLSTYETGTGAPVGTYAVTVTWPVETNSAFPPDRLGNRYSSAERSEWKATIQEGENELPPIAITGATINDGGRGPGGPPMMPGQNRPKRQGSGS